MKKSEIINISNYGVLNITAHVLDAAQSYKVFKFKKWVKNALKAIQDDEKDLLAEVGIADAPAFDQRRSVLLAKENKTTEEQAELDKLNSQAEGYFVRRNELYNEEVTPEVKTMPYEAWKLLQDENRAAEVGGKTTDILTGYVEDILEGVLWEAPDDQ